MWTFGGHHRRGLLIGLLLRIVHGAVQAVPAIVVVVLVDELRRSTLNGETALRLSLALVAAWLVQIAVAVAANHLVWSNSYRWGAELRHQLLSHVARLPIGALDERGAGDVAATMAQDIDDVEDFSGWVLPSILGHLALALVVAVTLFVVDTGLGVATMVSVIAAGPAFVWALRRFRDVTDERLALRGGVNAAIVEYVRGIAVVRAFNLAGVRHRRFNGAMDDLFEVERRLVRRVSPTHPAPMLTIELGVAVLVAWIAVRIDGDGFGIGAAVIALVLVMRVYEPLHKVAHQVELLPMVRAAGRRLDGILVLEVPPQPATVTALTGHRIELDEVSFSYVPGREVLRRVSVEIPERTMTAIVGPSGSGKTTILHLIAGLRAADRGAVRIGGVDLGLLTAEQLFGLVSVVFQDVQLFRGTIADNISFGRRDVGRAEIVEAARLARCEPFIEALPAGYDSMIGEGGLTLSGGERQRVAIARAVLKDAPIVLLDEPTASIDPSAARLVNEGLRSLVEHRTVVVVAHRLSTIRSADQIVMIDSGRVVAAGPHDRLVTESERYAAFWDARERSAGWQFGRSQPAENV